MRLGEIDRALDDMNGFLQQTECDLQELDDIYGDPKFIETHLKNLQVCYNNNKNKRSLFTINLTIRTIYLPKGRAFKKKMEKTELNLVDESLVEIVLS